MTKFVSKTKYITVFLLIAVILAFVLCSYTDYSGENLKKQIIPNENYFYFDYVHTPAAFLVQYKNEYLGKYQFVEQQENEYRRNLKNHIFPQADVSVQESVYINHGINVYPFYQIIYVLYLLMVIKYILKKDGKKHCLHKICIINN